MWGLVLFGGWLSGCCVDEWMLTVGGCLLWMSGWMDDLGGCLLWMGGWMTWVCGCLVVYCGWMTGVWMDEWMSG